MGCSMEERHFSSDRKLFEVGLDYLLDAAIVIVCGHCLHLNACHFIFNRSSKVVLWMYSTASFVLHWSLLILHSFTVDRGSGGVLFVAGATHWSWQWKCWNTIDQHPPFCLPKFNEQPFSVMVGSKHSGPFSGMQSCCKSGSGVCVLAPTWKLVMEQPRSASPKAICYIDQVLMEAQEMTLQNILSFSELTLCGLIEVVKLMLWREYLKQIYTIHHPPCNFIELERDAHPSVS